MSLIQTKLKEGDEDGGGDGDDGSLEFDNMLWFIIQNKIEVPKRQVGRETDKPKLLQNNLTINVLNIG
jgi:hypothetical protein